MLDFGYIDLLNWRILFTIFFYPLPFCHFTCREYIPRPLNSQLVIATVLDINHHPSASTTSSNIGNLFQHSQPAPESGTLNLPVVTQECFFLTPPMSTSSSGSAVVSRVWDSAAVVSPLYQQGIVVTQKFVTYRRMY